MDVIQIDADQLRQLRVNEKAMLLTILAEGREVSVTDAAQLMQWTLHSAGKCLRSLLDRGLLQQRRYGTFRLYSVSLRQNQTA